MPEIEIVRFDAALATHVDGVAAVCQSLGWPSYSDPTVVARGCGSPGVTTTVALEASGGVVGFAQVLNDGLVQGYLAQLGVLSFHRRQGIATRLLEVAFAASGVQRVDLVTDDADRFYESFAHRLKQGYRIYPT